MHQFKFRLETVHRLRKRLENEAKANLASKRNEITAVENDIAQLQRNIDGLYKSNCTSFNDLFMRDIRKSKYDDLIRSNEVTLSILFQEEEKLLEIYLKLKIELEMINKLEESERKTWTKEYEKYEQRKLDEFTILRRKN